jgi:glycosyltransferase involved in cell wall biosynthesis
MDLNSALQRLRDAPFLLDVMRSADDLAFAASRDGGPQAVAILEQAIYDETNEVVAIAAVHALGRVFDDSADALLSELLSSDRAFLREHAAWSFAARLPRLDAISRLVGCVVRAGFTGVLAQRTLQSWAASTPDHVALALEGALVSEQDHEARARLTETLGLVPGQVAGRALRQIAGNALQPDIVRIAAVAALGDRRTDTGAHKLVKALAWGDGELADAARLAQIDLAEAASPSPGARAAGTGLTIAQLFLHADIDRGLTRAGAGDNGGIATLLVRLGDALAQRPNVDRVITMSRGAAHAAAAPLIETAYPDASGVKGHILAPIALLTEPVSQSLSWPTRVAAERGIRRALKALGPVDVLHLRMADVGSMAAATVARELGIPVVFTLAPDPHGVIHALDMAGSLRLDNFGAADEIEHYWFRHRLVQRLANDAQHTVLFPRPNLRDDLAELLGVDIDTAPGRYTVVPEGIDLTGIEAAIMEVATENAEPRDSTTRAFTDLETLITSLPAHRHGLPIALSVGRLHRVKGMATIVEAWSSDPALRDSCNLVIVGGDLADPSFDERSQLDRIAAVIAQHPEAANGLILAGHRPNDVVARWLATARLGSRDLIGTSGFYVCGSLKEEFGIALLEALAAGLVVVAPAGGGPATYVENGVTGFLVNTSTAAGVQRGMADAAALAAGAPIPADRARIARAQTLVREKFTIQAMAEALDTVYTGVAASHERVLDTRSSL